MSWETKSVIMLRKEFISFVENRKINFSEICRRYKISRKTGYKWLEKHKNLGLIGLADSSKAPLTTPSKTKEEMEQAVIAVRVNIPNGVGGKSDNIY